MFVLANQATAAKRRVYFHLVGVDGITPATGESGGQPQISTNGASWTNTGIGTLNAIGNGRYYADLTQGAVASSGDTIETRYKSANTAECPGDSVRVVAFDPDSPMADFWAYASRTLTSVAGISIMPGPVLGDVLSLIQGDDYDANTQQAVFTSSALAGLTGYSSFTFVLWDNVSNTAVTTSSVTYASGPGSFTVDSILAATTTGLEIGNARYSWKIYGTTTAGSKRRTLWRGAVVVYKKQTA